MTQVIVHARLSDLLYYRWQGMKLIYTAHLDDNLYWQKTIAVADDEIIGEAGAFFEQNHLDIDFNKESSSILAPDAEITAMFNINSFHGDEHTVFEA